VVTHIFMKKRRLKAVFQYAGLGLVMF
jgi:hypothetical protein